MSDIEYTCICEDPDCKEISDERKRTHPGHICNGFIFIYPGAGVKREKSVAFRKRVDVDFCCKPDGMSCIARHHFLVMHLKTLNKNFNAQFLTRAQALQADAELARLDLGPQFAQRENCVATVLMGFYDGYEDPIWKKLYVMMALSSLDHVRRERALSLQAPRNVFSVGHNLEAAPQSALHPSPTNNFATAPPSSLSVGSPSILVSPPTAHAPFVAAELPFQTAMDEEGVLEESTSNTSRSIVPEAITVVDSSVQKSTGNEMVLDEATRKQAEPHRSILSGTMNGPLNQPTPAGLRAAPTMDRTVVPMTLTVEPPVAAAEEGVALELIEKSDDKPTPSRATTQPSSGLAATAAEPEAVAQSPLMGHDDSSTLQADEPPTDTSLLDDLSVTTASLHQWSTATGVEEEEDSGGAVPPVVIKIHSTTITITVNQAGAQIAVSDASNNAVAEMITVSSPSGRTSPLVGKRKANGISECSLLTVATATENETFKEPRKLQSRSHNNKDAMAKHSRRKLAVDVTGRVDRPGNALFRQKLAFYQPSFANSQNETERNHVMEMFLNGFSFQEPIDDDWLVLGPSSARQMLLEALTSSGDEDDNAVPQSLTITAPPRSRNDPTTTACSSAAVTANPTKRQPRLHTSSDSNKLVVYCGSDPCWRTQPGNAAYLDTIRSHQTAYVASRTSDAQRQAIVADIASRFEFVRQEGRRWRLAAPEWVVNKVQLAMKQTPALPSVPRKLVPPTTVASSLKPTSIVKRATQPLKRVTVATNKPIVFCGGVEAGYGEPGNIAYLECIQAQNNKFLALSNNERLALAQSIAERFTFVRLAGCQWEPASEKWAVKKVRLALLIKAQRSATKPSKSSTTSPPPVPLVTPVPLVKPSGGVFAVAKEESTEEAPHRRRSESVSTPPKVDWDEVLVLR
jgi:hypothetical protein